jgi:hypothetical protein
LRNDLWPHAALLVTILENTIVDQKGSTPHFILTGTNPNWVQNLRTFGEIGIVCKKPTKIHSKLENRTSPNWAKNLRTFGEIGIVYTKPPIRNKFENHGSPCIFIGYVEDHTSHVFKFHSPKTYAVILSRNVNKSYGEFYKVRPTASPCEIRQAHRHMAEDTFTLPYRKDPPSNAVARAMIPHFNPFQPHEPDELPPPNFDND